MPQNSYLPTQSEVGESVRDDYLTITTLLQFVGGTCPPLLLLLDISHFPSQI